MSSVFVYRLFDNDGDLLYIGCTGNVERRISQHIYKGTGGGSDIAHYTVQEYPTRHLGLAAEAKAILDEQPRLNVRLKHRAGVDLQKVGDPSGALGPLVAWRVAQRMLAMDLGILQLARDCEIPHTRLSRSLGRGNFRVNDLCAIATRLGVGVRELFQEQESVA